MENLKEQNAEDIDISASINKNLDIPLLIKKKLHLRDLRRKNKDLSGKHADIKKVLQEKESYFSFKEKVHNESREKMIKEYQMATKDNYDRQVILEEKIKNKEKKIKMYDLEINKFKVAIADMHERIKKADYDLVEREKCLSFLSKFKENSAEFVQLDMFDRLETIFSSREFIKKKKESLKAKINIIKAKIKDTEEKYNLALMDKEKEYKNLVETSEGVLKKEKEIAEQLKEKINEHNKNALLLYKIISCVDNFLSRFSSFLPELRHYNVKKDEEKNKLEKKNKPQDIMEDTQFIDTADFKNLEEDILRKLDVIYKYIKDTIYIINKAKKEISLKDDNYMESMKNNFDDNIEFLTYNNIKGKNN
ncbi:conserved Plasmodium protein, unknown function [Plasmodium vivax]|uniref:(malaria parasite P. vivax) hypothetical protein n=1 Tax=Plasmodium vivax TaxID=5855 RepID=A0A1G4HCH8_PLAVI|nr:unnamed protein product [Plasmodium vivax]CAI7720413.1 conserved protein, unknown function [Plasmodium vivax]SCO67229.1 conserved Plasmodium protein, unknown function [Plasmodium vivax]SCO72616.1 conserved Plasmodium protein, unknown function [Plasmodium vivax]VUZ95788.1 conserved Plasmodium protein, unknown function [Plasmodium vivax]